jgi:Family of unknown function (DUF5681)
MSIKTRSKVVSTDQDDSSDVTEGLQKPQLYKPGQSGNPKGRPKGARGRINEKFLGALERIWDDHGEDMMAKAAISEPMQFVKLVAGLLPSKVESKLEITNVFAEYNLTDPREFSAAWEIARRVIYGEAPMMLEAETEREESLE